VGNAPIVSGADLEQAVTAKGIGGNNEPIGITDTFSESEDVLYCVVEANRIDAGTNFYARFLYEGEPFEDTPVITAEQDYSDTHIEFHIEPADFGVLEAGDYACKIYVNGNPVQTVEFRVRLGGHSSWKDYPRLCAWASCSSVPSPCCSSSCAF